MDRKRSKTTHGPIHGERGLLGTPARALWGLRVVGRNGERLGYVSSTVRRSDGERFAIIRRERPRWSYGLVNLAVHGSAPSAAMLVSLAYASRSPNGMICLDEVPAPPDGTTT
jgi:hypothetical protein